MESDKTNLTSNNPHYKVGGIQPIEYMKYKMTQEQYFGFCIGNVHKYMGRLGHKDDRLKELYKVRDYLNWAIETLEEQKKV